MRSQLEEEVHDVHDQKDDGGAVGEEEDVLPGVGLGGREGCIESRGDDQGGRCNGHHGGHGGCRGAVEGLFVIVNSAEEEAASEDKEDVGEHAAQHAGLDDANFILGQSNDADLQPRPLAHSFGGKKREVVIKKKKKGHTMSSTAFPKVALSSPPSVSPRVEASSSVAKLRREARGMIAMKLSTKVAVGDHFRKPESRPRGTKTSRMLI